MTPEQARVVANVLGQQLQGEWMTTYKVLNAIPESAREHRDLPAANGRQSAEHLRRQLRRAVARVC